MSGRRTVVRNLSNPYDSLARKPEKLSDFELSQHLERNTVWNLPFFNSCPNCKSINIGVVGFFEGGLGAFNNHMVCVDCDAHCTGREQNYLQLEYQRWLLSLELENK